MKTAKITLIKNQVIENYDHLHRNISRNNKLSDNAKAVYIFINSQANNYQLTIESISNQLKKSKDSIKRAIRELKKSGFLELEKIPNSNNYKYIIYDTPSNYEYMLIENINNLDYKDLEAIYKILNNQQITQETRNKIDSKLRKILKYNWLEDDSF